MKKEVMLGVMMTVLAGLFIFYVASGYKTKSSLSNTAGITPQAVTTGNNIKTMTVSEVAKHNSQSDCYIMIINSKVYNITSYINSHPGGLGFVSYCGQEATQAFDTKGGRGQGHSDYAVQLLNDYYIADLQ